MICAFISSKPPGDGYALAGIGNQPVHTPERIAFVGLGGLADGFLSGLPVGFWNAVRL